MVTSTPPLSGASGQNGGGFQPPSSAQLLGVPVANPNPGMPYQLQFLMALQQQQQRGLPANVLNQIMALKHLFYPQGFQSSQTRQDHGAAGSMLNSPVPSELSVLSAFQHASTPLSNSDSSHSFLSPQNQSSFGSSSSNTASNSSSVLDSSFQMPLQVLQNTELSVKNLKPTRRRNRPGGPTVKTAEVWRFFKPKPAPEQAATCDICQKTIKATNSSTTGMIRHLRSCHHEQHLMLEDARNKNNILKTLAACTDEKSRGDILKALSASSGFFGQPGNHSTTGNVSHMADSSTNSSISPHSIDSLLEVTSDQKPPNPISINSAPPSSAFMISPKKYMESVKKNLTQVENKTKNAIEQTQQPEDLNEEVNESEEDQDEEDVENLAVTEEDSEEDGALVSKPKRAKFIEPSNKEFPPKSIKQNAHFEAVEKHIALMLLLDDQSPEEIDRLGFRQLLALLVPGYHLPPPADFKSKIIPQVRSQLPNGDIAGYRQRLLENNRFILHHPATQWPISPSTTCESGFDELVEGMSETASSASLHIVEQSVRAQNISQSFGFSTPIHQTKKKLISAAEEEEELDQQRETHIKTEPSPCLSPNKKLT